MIGVMAGSQFEFNEFIGHTITTIHPSMSISTQTTSLGEESGRTSSL